MVVGPNLEQLWRVKRNDGSMAQVYRDVKVYEVMRPSDMSRTEFFTRLYPGTFVDEDTLRYRFKLWSQRPADKLQ